MKHLKNFSKEKIIQLFLIFSYLICWFSISTSLEDVFLIFDEFSDNQKSITNYINFLRHGLIYVCLFFLLIIFFLNFKKFLSKNNNLILFIFLIYFLFQIPGLYLTENLIINLSFVISSITIILTLILINDFFNQSEKNIFLIFSFTILFVVFVLSIYPKIISLYEGISMYGGYDPLSSIFLNKSSPRSSGMARSALIILLLGSLLNSKYLNSKYFFIFFKILLITIILLLQSRVIIALTLISLISIFVIKYKFSIKNIVNYSLLYLVIPISLFLISTNYSEKTAALKMTNEFLINKGLEKTDLYFDKYLNPQIRLDKNIDITSGRLNDWISIKENFDKNKIFIGYGAQADRYLINQSASNGIIYSLISSGIFGFIFFVIFSFIVFFQSSKKLIFLKKDNLNNDLILHIIILIILARSLVETSYAVFGIDLIMLITVLSLKKVEFKYD